MAYLPRKPVLRVAISNRDAPGPLLVSKTSSAIQALVYFSVALGVVFLAQVYDLLPSAVFDVIALGWVLFVVDAVLLSFRPRAARVLALALALLALASSLPQSAHYAFIEAGEVLPSLTFILGSAAQVLLVILVPADLIRGRGTGRATPGSR